MLSAPPSLEDNCQYVDPVLAAHAEDLKQFAGKIGNIAYLSTTGVYGNRDGQVVAESAAPIVIGGGSAPDASVVLTPRQRARARAEREWAAFLASGGQNDPPARSAARLHVLRLAGIYGPGKRNSLSQLPKTTRLIDKPTHQFNRVHVEDIARVVCLTVVVEPSSSSGGKEVEILNLADDCPASSKEVVEYACALVGRDPPPTVSFADVEEELSPMLREFYAHSKVVSNEKVKESWGELLFPSYREGLRNIWEHGGWEGHEEKLSQN